MNELKKVMGMDELKYYVSYNEDMCLELKEYKDHVVIVEFMCGPRDEFYNITIYTRCEGMNREKREHVYYLRVMEVRYDWTCYNGDVKEDEIFAFANKMIDAYVSR